GGYPGRAQHARLLPGGYRFPQAGLRLGVTRLHGRRGGRVKYFHATEVKLEPGEFISPGFKAHPDTGDPDGLVWFCDDPIQAEEWVWLRHQDSEDWDLTIFIYAVEPTGEVEPDRGIATRQVGPGNYQSRQPLRITK